MKKIIAIDPDLAPTLWYDPTRPLEKGSFGTVYRGTLTFKGISPINVAIKVVPLSQKAPCRTIDIEREFNMMATLDKIGVPVPQAYYINYPDTDNGITHAEIVMEFVDGEDLTQIEFLDITHILQAVGIPLLRSLKVAIEARVWLGDIKLEDIFLGSRLTILDHNLTFRIDQTPKEACGTPCYISPELVENDRAGFDLKNPLFSAGVILCQVILRYQPVIILVDHLFATIARRDFVNDQLQLILGKQDGSEQGPLDSFDQEELSRILQLNSRQSTEVQAKAFHALFSLLPEMTNFPFTWKKGEPIISFIYREALKIHLKHSPSFPQQAIDPVVKAVTQLLAPIDQRPSAADAILELQSAIKTIQMAQRRPERPRACPPAKRPQPPQPTTLVVPSHFGSVAAGGNR